MSKRFQSIGLISRSQPHKPDIITSLGTLISYLEQNHYQVIIDEETALSLPGTQFATSPRAELGAVSDLVIVVGGDGSLLNAARSVVDHNTPLLGINRGQLGFLTDIHPDDIVAGVAKVLAGHFFEELRFLLNAEIIDHGKHTQLGSALNDVVLLPGDVPQMIEFDMFINEEFVCRQRADGLIVATPTGSTAYALSGGGPILHPHLDALVIVPMFPHTLSSRPIVVSGDSKITLVIAESRQSTAYVSCDGHNRVAISPGAKVHIKKKPTQLRLIHPQGHNFFETLTTKLHWESRYH